MLFLTLVFSVLLLWLISSVFGTSSIKVIVGTHVLRFFYKRSPRSSRQHQNSGRVFENQATNDTWRQPTNDRSAYKMLKLHYNASEEEIIGAYRKLVQQYHPDKVANLAPEFREVAERRIKEINAAYAQLKRSVSG